MRDHGPDERPRIGVDDGDVSRAGDFSSPTTPGDLVFDFSELEPMRVQDLSVLLTARRLALEHDRTVWAADVPMEIWETLQALGLTGYFRPFPAPDVRTN